MSTYQQIRRHYSKLAKLGSRRPLSDAERLMAFEGADFEHNLRSFSVKKTERQVNGLKAKFPLVGKALQRLAPHEQQAYLHLIGSVGINEAEQLLKKGFSIQDLNTVSPSIADRVRKTATGENIDFFVKRGFSKTNAKSMTVIFEEFHPKKVEAFFNVLEHKRVRIAEARQSGKGSISASLLKTLLTEYLIRPKQVLGFLDVVASGAVFSTPTKEMKYWFFAELVHKHGLEKAVELAKGKKIFKKRATNEVTASKHAFDYRRTGRILKELRLNMPVAAARSLAARGVQVFPSTVRIKKAIGSTAFIEKDRHVVYLEVPAFESLLRHAKRVARKKGQGIREHVRGTLGFADVRVFKGFKNPKEKFVYIQELQSDIVQHLPAHLQKRFGSWEKILILSIAKMFEKEGVEHISLSTPQTVDDVWQGMGKEKLMRTYYSVPKEMGFYIVPLKNPVFVRDMAFGTIRTGILESVWSTSIEGLKLKYPEFFATQ